jgi:hypothetical protein
VSKIRTSIDLQTQLDKEFSWRLKEIASLKLVVRTTDSLSKETAVRAALPLLYGHWEGFVKASSELYLTYVNSQSLKYSELKTCFVVFGLRKKLNEVASTNSSEHSISILDFLREEMNEKATLKFESAIKTESNLSSSVFSNIANSIGIETGPYEPKYNLIDESLLKRRNYIAHGEFLDVDIEGFRDLADEILTLLRVYKTDIENAVTLKSYLA